MNKEELIPENPNDSVGMQSADFTKIIFSFTAWVTIVFGIILELTNGYSTFLSEESIHSPKPLEYFIDGRGLIIIGIILFLINRGDRNYNPTSKTQKQTHG